MGRPRPKANASPKSPARQPAKINETIAEQIERIREMARAARLSTPTKPRRQPATPAPSSRASNAPSLLKRYWAIEDRVNKLKVLPDNAKRVFLRMIRDAQAGKPLWTDGVPKLASLLSLCERTVFYALAALEAAGAIHIKKDFSKASGLQVASIITLKPNWPPRPANGKG